MKSSVVRRVAVAGVCAVLGVGVLAVPGYADPNHATVVNSVSEAWVPHVVVTPGVRKPVAYTIAEAGSQMVVGGDFDRVENGSRTTQYDRSNVFAFNATTGVISTSFAPVVDGDVWSTYSDGTSVYIGGGFKNVNGTPRAALAKLDLATGQLDPNFAPTFKSGRVSDMEMVHGRLVVSGTFSARLIALNPATGKPTTFIPNVVGGRLPNSNSAQVFKFDVSPDGSRLVAVGNFLTVDGQPRPRAFMLNLDPNAGATLSEWNYEPLGVNCTSTRTNAQAYVQDVNFSPDSSYFAFAAFGFMYQPGQFGKMICDSVSRFETSELNPTEPSWINYTGGDSLKSVAVTGAAIYVQGHSRWLDNPFGRDFPGAGAVDRLGGGAVNPTTGLALAWNPVMPQQSGGYQIVPTEAGVWFVTDGTKFGSTGSAASKYHAGIRFAKLP